MNAFYLPHHNLSTSLKNTKKPTQEEEQQQQQQWGNVYAQVLFQDFLGHHKKL
jgi:hypothetical protein